MSEVVDTVLPNNWHWENLKNLGEWSGGGTPSKSNPNFWSERDIPWVSPKDMKVKKIVSSQDYISKTALEKTNLRLLPEGSLLMVTRSGILAHSFPVAINDVPVTVNQDLKTLELSNELNDKYVYYALKRYEQAILKECSKHGTTVHSIEMPKLMRFQIPVAPPDQQKHIVAKIEELFSHIDAGIEALKKAKQLLNQYRQSMLKAAVTGELTKEWRKANKDKLEPASQLLERILEERRRKWEELQFERLMAKGKVPKDDRWKEKYKEPNPAKGWNFLCELPESWLWVSADEIGDSQDQAVLTGPFGSNLGKKDFIQEGVPVLTIGCLRETGIDLSRAMHVSDEKAQELERYQLREGDVMFSRMAAVGRAGFVTSEYEGSLFNYHIMRLRFHPNAIMQEYFVSYVRGSSQVYDYVREVNHGATRDGINTQQLLEMPVALAPVAEQEEICRIVKDKLNSVRRLETDIDNQLIKAEKNRQSILSSFFSGKLV